MTEKQKRIMQLESLKSGIFPGVYRVRVSSFDGLVIKSMVFEDEQQCNSAYAQLVRDYRGYAHISRTIEFTFE